MQAIAVSKPWMQQINDDGEALAYLAEMQYKTKKPEVKCILCTPLDDVRIGDRVDVTYLVHKHAYHHKYRILSSNQNTYGGFYYTNGSQA